MKKNKLMMAVVISAGLMFGACGSKETQESPAEEPVKEVVINTTHAYICPMDCENSASMEPGQCPVCGMDLVANPNYEGAATETPEEGSVDEAAGNESHNHDDHEGHNH